MPSNQKVTALILAASRRGAEDSVAKVQNVSHKCLVTIDGMIMLERVVREVKAAKDVGAIYVSIEKRELLEQIPALNEMLEKGEIHFTPSADNLYLSVRDAVANINPEWPLIVTTGDNALHTAEIINYFTDALAKSAPDIGVAMTPADVILNAYPDGKRAFHTLKDGGWSSCNLYAIKGPHALEPARVFEGGGQFGKNPNRILKAFGLMFMILYRWKLTTSTRLSEILSKRWGLKVQIIKMPFADAPIDVDNPGDLERTEQILIARRNGTPVK
ncbi:hypothetical protein GCM10017044_02140 [Kordiimonas sediminis]|uniref:MobA-like NTP transferase domain-containing protein n=1 Tax=Kordiimonas sediminis TaxID=1735581 RepID=A0A919AIT8_9PROT|nr:NTP transferase domain-containing protein [Kordiimonas sediminis]GHF11858.1 hypothetical protein GCM10017044_02140 [Kordiimonas sediminis]